MGGAVVRGGGSFAGGMVWARMVSVPFLLDRGYLGMRPCEKKL